MAVRRSRKIVQRRSVSSLPNLRRGCLSALLTNLGQRKVGFSVRRAVAKIPTLFLQNGNLPATLAQIFPEVPPCVRLTPNFPGCVQALA